MKTKKCIKYTLLASFILLLLVYLNGCARTKQDMLNAGMKQLTTQELKSLFSKKQTAKVFYVKKYKWYTFNYLPDGSIVRTRHGRVRDYVYFIDNDRFCMKRRPTSHKKYCSAWFEISQNQYQSYLSDGSMEAKLNFQ